MRMFALESEHAISPTGHATRRYGLLLRFVFLSICLYCGCTHPPCSGLRRFETTFASFQPPALLTTKSSIYKLSTAVGFAISISSTVMNGYNPQIPNYIDGASQNVNWQLHIVLVIYSCTLDCLAIA